MMRPSVTGLILAGGQGSRMGGVDKGLIEWQGRPLVLHVAQRLAPQVDRLMISANRNLERYSSFGWAVVADRTMGYDGPLAGLDAGLGACTTPLLAMVPCDAPHLPLDLVARLHSALGNGLAAVAASADGLQPAFLLCRREAAPRLADWLAGGQRKLAGWLTEIGATIVPFTDTAAFANFNTPEDLR
jgi:molybdopterin-guanine dinucleotide biosynthesis protein A